MSEEIDKKGAVDADRRKAVKKYAAVLAGSAVIAVTSKEALAGNCGYGGGSCGNYRIRRRSGNNQSFRQNRRRN